MASAPNLWLQTVASVLSFTPPGLLLVATGLQLRQIPVHRTSQMLREQRVRISRAIGAPPQPNGGREHVPSTIHSRFVSHLRETIERACRRGENPLPTIATIEKLLDLTRDHLQRTVHQLAGISARTTLALIFTGAICLLMRLVQESPAADTRTIWLGAGAAGCIATCGCLPPLHQIRRAMELLDFSQGKTANMWIDSIGSPGKNQSWTRTGVAFDEEHQQFIRDECHDRMVLVTKSLTRAERLIIVYEMIALLPASILLVISQA
ncbi:hypothetical protein EBZ80_03030 [bacterium]|nr:hypothetical protein [bacterium]